MDESKNDNNEDFEEELAGEEIKEPLPNFGDEIEYQTEKNHFENKKSKGFKFPRFSFGWLGIVLVILIMLFLFLPKGPEGPTKNDFLTVGIRLDKLESQMGQIDKVHQKIDHIEADLLKGIQLSERLDKLESLLILNTDRLGRDVSGLKEEINRIKQPPPTPKPKAEEKKPAVKEKEPVKVDTVKYHTVRRGENIYRIALRYGLSETELLQLNQLKKGAIIYPGQKLKVSK